MSSREPPVLAPPAMYTGERRPGQQPGGPLQVTITDINIPFFSLMWLLVKMALAAIPAAIIVALLWALLVGVIGSVIRSFGPHWTPL